MLNLATYASSLKPFFKNSDLSNEDLLNSILSPYVEAASIKNKNGDDYYLDKTRVSNILNNKEDVPGILRVNLEKYGIREKTIDEMQLFIEDRLILESEKEIVKRIMQLIEEDADLEAEIKKHMQIIKNELPILMSEALMLSIKLCNRIRKQELIILRHGSYIVDVIVGDIFNYGFNNRKKNKNILVIPVNTSFETHVTRIMEHSEKPLVSANTIHGQWLIRWEQSGNSVLDLDNRIRESIHIKGQSYIVDPYDYNIDYNGNPIGSIASIEEKNTIYYLLAISRFDQNNNAMSSRDEILQAIISLINYYNMYGEGYDLYIPLLGTGRSRAGLELQEAYDLLKDTLIKKKREIHGNIHIVLSKSWADQVKR